MDADLVLSIYYNKVVDIVDFVESIDKNGKNLDRFNDDFISFLKDVLIYKNTSNLDDSIEDKGNSIKKVAKVCSVLDLYKIIIDLNDLSNKIKNSSFSKILFIVEFINLANYFKTENDTVDNNKDNVRKDKDNNKKSVITVEKVNIISNNTSLSDKNRKIRINNAFSSASKDLKDKFINKWTEVLDRVVNDSAYSTIAGMINDVEILVVGECNVLFLAKYDSLLDRLFQQLDKIEQLLYDVFNIKYKIMFLLDDEWKYEKNNYISNIKNGIKYNYIEEEIEKFNEEKKDEDIEKIVSILGDEVISYK